jgi:hypothetical protein
MLTETELDSLQRACQAVSLTKSRYEASDFVAAMFDTVLDYMNHVETVRKAGQYFRECRWEEVRTLEDLERVLATFPDDRTGNEELARYLWGNRHWTRVQQLRGLVRYFRELNVTDLDSLRRWAATSRPEDFLGRVKGLGPAVYRWLVMRVGVETVKPDVHVLRFVAAAIGRGVSEAEAVAGLEEVARRLDTPARLLDWSIWEGQRGGAFAGPASGGSMSQAYPRPAGADDRKEMTRS